MVDRHVTNPHTTTTYHWQQPEVEVADIAVAGPEAVHTQWAAVAGPGMAVPGVAVPEVAAPEGAVPEGAVPEGAVLEGAVLEGAVPGALCVAEAVHIVPGAVCTIEVGLVVLGAAQVGVEGHQEH